MLVTGPPAPGETAGDKAAGKIRTLVQPAAACDHDSGVCRRCLLSSCFVTGPDHVDSCGTAGPICLPSRVRQVEVPRRSASGMLLCVQQPACFAAGLGRTVAASWHLDAAAASKEQHRSPGASNVRSQCCVRFRTDVTSCTSISAADWQGILCVQPLRLISIQDGGSRCSAPSHTRERSRCGPIGGQTVRKAFSCHCWRQVSDARHPCSL